MPGGLLWFSKCLASCLRDPDPPDPHNFVADPDSSSLFLMRIQILIKVIRICNHWSTKNLHGIKYLSCERPLYCFILSIHSSRILTLTRIRIRLFTLMQIRIRLSKMMRVHADPDPQHWPVLWDFISACWRGLYKCNSLQTRVYITFWLPYVWATWLPFLAHSLDQQQKDLRKRTSSCPVEQSKCAILTMPSICVKLTIGTSIQLVVGREMGG